MTKLYSFAVERDEFNGMLGGGLPGNSIVLIDGKEGTGKSIVTQRILYGLLKNGASATYISSQLTTKEFITQMYSLGYKISEHLIHGSLLYIPVYPLLYDIRPRYDFIDRLMSTESLYKNDIIIMDSITPLTKYDSNEEKTTELMAFFKKIVNNDKVLILTSDTGKIESEIERSLCSESDIYMTTDTRMLGGDIKHFIIVNRFTGATDTFSAIITFKVEAKVGLIIEISTIV
jgi:flagellar protein FlaH